MIEALEPIESEERQADIDEFIYVHYEEFKPYIVLYEELVGTKSESDWEERYLEGHSSGVQKYYKTEKDEMEYTLSVRLVKHDEVDRNLTCEITIRDAYF